MCLFLKIHQISSWQGTDFIKVPSILSFYSNKLVKRKRWIIRDSPASCSRWPGPGCSWLWSCARPWSAWSPRRSPAKSWWSARPRCCTEAVNIYHHDANITWWQAGSRCCSLDRSGWWQTLKGTFKMMWIRLLKSREMQQKHLCRSLWNAMFCHNIG